MKEKSREYRRDIDVGSESMGRMMRCNRFSNRRYSASSTKV
jgi:hypothetical protein